MTTTLDVFISSKMVELKAERDALYDFIPSLDYGDIKLHAWLFEKDVPASNHSIRDEYLAPLRNAELYLGLFWNLYGEWTIDEFDRATEWGKERLIYIKNVDADKRDPKLTDFLNKNSDVMTGITPKWFEGSKQEEQIADLCEKVKQTLDGWVAKYRSGPSGESSARLYKSSDAIIERSETLIGRDEDLAKVKTFLGQNERILIQGFSGTGKTALAAEAAAQFIADNPGHILWLRIGRNDTESIFEALASVFDARIEMAKQSGDGKVHLLRTLLSESEIRLIVLDDAWNSQALPTIIKAIPPHMPLIVTSRRYYGLNQRVSIVDLMPEAGLELLSYHAKVDYRENKSAQELCSVLSNLPFALRIAGMSLKMRRQTPSELLTEIKNAPHDLALPLDFSEKGRESVAKLLQISLNALDEEARALFLAFGAFSVPELTMEMLTIFMKQPRTQWIDGDVQKIPVKVISLQPTKFDVNPYRKLLNVLEIHGLIDRIPTNINSLEHYRIHDLAYIYAREQTTWEQRFSAINSCLNYTEIYGEVKLENFNAIYPELNNLIGAARQALDMGMYGEIEKLIESLYIGSDSNGGVLIKQGYPQHSIKILEYGIEASIRTGNEDNQSSHLGNLAIAYVDLGDFDNAVVCAEKALVIQRKLDRKVKIGNQLTTLGIISERQGKYDIALDYHIQALQLYDDEDAKLGIANQLGNIGNTYYRLGQFENAKAYYFRSLELHRKLFNRKGESHQLEGLGLLEVADGNHERAISYFNSALKISRDIGEKHTEAGLLNNLGETHRDIDRCEDAINYLDKALLIAQSINARYLEGRILGNLGNSYCKLRNYEKGEYYLSSSLKLKRELGDKEGEANTINSLGAMYAEQENYLDALVHFQEALKIYLSINTPHLAERAQRNIIRMQKQLNL